MIILLSSEDGSTDTARESGSVYTKIQRAMTKGSFQAWGDMQPTDLCLGRQVPLIILHCCMLAQSMNKKQSKAQILEYKHMVG